MCVPLMFFTYLTNMHSTKSHILQKLQTFHKIVDIKKLERHSHVTQSSSLHSQ